MSRLVRTLQMNIHETILSDRIQDKLGALTIIIGSCPRLQFPNRHPKQSADTQLSRKIRHHHRVHTPPRMELVDVWPRSSRVPHQNKISRNQTLSPPRLVHRMIIQNCSSLETELVNQGRSHNGLIRTIQWLALWNLILLHAGLSQTDVAPSNVGGIKVGYVRREPTPIWTEYNHCSMTH